MASMTCGGGCFPPVADMGSVVKVWTARDKWRYVLVTRRMSIPASSPFIVDLGPISPTSSVDKKLVDVLKVPLNQFIQMRWLALDNVIGKLWVPIEQGLNALQSTQAGIEWRTAQIDPGSAMSEFFAIGIEQNAGLSAENKTKYTQPNARFLFWGYRYDFLDINMDAYSLPEQEEIKRRAIPVVADASIPTPDFSRVVSTSVVTVPLTGAPVMGRR